MLRGSSGPSVSSIHIASRAPPALPSRIFCEIISEVVEVKTKRSTLEPGATASSRRLSVPCTFTATNSELSCVSICGLWRAAACTIAYVVGADDAVHDGAVDDGTD